MRITPEVIAAIESAATHANAKARTVSVVTDPVEFMQSAYELSRNEDPDRLFYVVWSSAQSFQGQSDVPEDARVVCATGNGPTSEANAWLFAHLDPETVLELLRSYRQASDLVRNMRTTLSFFSSVIKSGEPWTTSCQTALDVATAMLNDAEKH